MAELIRTVNGLFARFPLDEENKARRARAIDQRARVLAQWLDAHAARDSNGDEAAWRLKPCRSIMFVNLAGELDQKHDQDLRDILGYDLGVAITGTERIGTTLVITEGFGEIAMADRTFQLLKSRVGHEASVSGAKV